MISKRLRYRKLAVLALVLPLLALGGAAEAKKKPPPVPWTGPVPKADCGPNDRVETGLQGQTTVAERMTGASMQAYNCNLELVGQFEGEGANWMMAWRDDCAYYGTVDRPQLQHPGVVVVDASDPRNPQATAYLDTPAMLNPHESLKVHQKRKLLAGGQRSGPGFAIYDVSDCRQPVLKASIELPEGHGHEGDFTPDGLTYYSAETVHPEFAVTAVDVSDPSNPKPLIHWSNGDGPGRVHGLSFSKDGTRGYFAQPGTVNFPAFPHLEIPNGLVIVDVSDIQFRRPNPQIRVISTLFWEDGALAQVPVPVTIRGRPYIIFSDEVGSGRLGPATACARGLPPHGFARIIDISDERNPTIVAKLMLEAHDPANCPSVVDDPVRGIGYSSHYCNVDKRRNPKLLACTYGEAGLRVFDIRDPFRPREIAYYKPPARRTAFLPGSTLWAAGADRTADGAGTDVRFRRHKGETHIWFVSQDNGFQIVRFTQSMRELLGKGKDDDDDGARARDDGRRGRDRDDD